MADNPQRYARTPEREASPLPLRQITYGLGRKPSRLAVFAIRCLRVVVYVIRHVAQRDLRPEDI
ncbi:MAG: hypothetical protein NTY19_15875 [Planctomycetota bacterium]|nr:hypothetical protein [Planctomycetota bacterium]